MPLDIRLSGQGWYSNYQQSALTNQMEYPSERGWSLGSLSVPDINPLADGSLKKPEGPRRGVRKPRVSGRHSGDLREMILYQTVQLCFNILATSAALLVLIDWLVALLLALFPSLELLIPLPPAGGFSILGWCCFWREGENRISGNLREHSVFLWSPSSSANLGV